MDLTFTPDDQKAVAIQRELGITIEEAQYIVDLRAHIVQKTNNRSIKGLVLTLYALGAIAGQIAEAAMSELDMPAAEARIHTRRTLMQAYEGAIEESAKARLKVGRMQ